MSNHKPLWEQVQELASNVWHYPKGQEDLLLRVRHQAFTAKCGIKVSTSLYLAALGRWDFTHCNKCFPI